MKGLAFWPNGFKHITNSEREIKEPSDLKGLKIRTHGGEILNDSYKQFGAASTKIAFNDVYQALQLGTIDGQENNLTNIKSQSYDEVQGYLSLTNHTRTEYGLVANKGWWDDLNDQTKKLLSDAVDEATKKGRELAKKESEEALKEIEAAGKMKVHKMTEEEHDKFVQILQPVIDKWSKKMDPEIIENILDMQK
ncbi:TRAP transporter substrate-binding protein DctP [Virgibacillus halophilus]|uniref:TRAP transporter substrate-binding protein DctP n=1 Tax=Tigheibacillus halophilus TaxID=361280 RepID=A0ABU5C2K6_9BACI|nr:TRAP transporter substrate-binding protein DctP [Virgibacillus halophilus]